MKQAIIWLGSLLPLAGAAQDNESLLLKQQHVTHVTIFDGTRLAATRHYDADGNLLASSEDSFLAEGIQTSSILQLTRQHQLGSLKSTHSASRDTTFWRYHYGEDLLLHAITDGYTGHVVQRLTYTDDFQIATRLTFDTTNQVVIEEHFTYDGRGNKVAWTQTIGSLKDRNGGASYDAQGRAVKEELFNGPALFFTELTSYLPSGEKSRVLDIEGTDTTGVAYSYGPTKKLQSRRHFTRQAGRDSTTGFEAFTYLPTGLLSTYTEDIFSAQHRKRTFSYQYK